MWGIFEALEDQASEPSGYQNALKQMPRLNCTELAKRSNVSMIKELARMFPGQGVGERLMIDGMALPAWCKQAPKGKTRKQEEYRRRFTPDAGYRAYIHQSQSKKNLSGGEVGTAAKFLRAGKAWRGYYLVCIGDQATGLPLVWTIIDAAEDEARCIVPLLSDLYRLWPECPAKLIAGDSAWDETRGAGSARSTTASIRSSACMTRIASAMSPSTRATAP
jgi:hypothetical protein